MTADAILTTGNDSGLLQRYATAKGAKYVVVLPEASDWLLDQVRRGLIKVAIGSDGAKLWR